MKVAIVGGAPSSCHLAPFDDKEWDIWVLGNQIDKFEGKRITRLFEIHDDLTEHGDEARYAEMLVNLGKPMIVGDRFLSRLSSKSVKHVSVFDFDSANALMGGEHLTSSPAYMMAQAIMEGATEISIYGCDMAVDDLEYFYQRPTMYAWIGYAIGKGIKITIPDESPLFKDTYNEGKGKGGKPELGVKPFVQSEFSSMAKMHADVMEKVAEDIKQKQADLNAHNAARQIYARLADTARAVESGQVIRTLNEAVMVKE